MWLPTLLLLFAPIASGSSKTEQNAEAVRLYEEMQRLSQRTAWKGVERQYARLTTLKRAEYPANAHLLGARAAQANGDILHARDRAQRAVREANGDMDTLTQASMFLTEFEIYHGPVTIQAPPNMKTIPPILAVGATFKPSTRAALEYANQILLQDRVFKGFLPLGAYQVGLSPFDVLPVEKPLLVTVTPGGSPVPAPAPVPTTPDAPDTRIVVLAVRGAFWPADQWDVIQAPAIEVLKAIEGVQLVDAFNPTQAWLIVEFDRKKMTESGLDETMISQTLPEPFTRIDDGERLILSLAPPHDLATRAVQSRMLGELQLSDFATVRTALTGPFPVPEDNADLARYRIEVKYSGHNPEDLLKALKTLNGTNALGFKLEEAGAH